MTFLKSLVVCLVLANAGYFLWIRGIAQSREIPIVPPPVATLTLAAESAAVRPAATDAAGSSARDTASGVDAARDAGPAGLPANARRCLSVGPFRDVADAAHAATMLRAGGYDPRQRVEQGEVWVGNKFWIDVDLKATGDLLNPADLQGEAGHIVRLEVKGCPSVPGGGQ